MTTFNPIQPSMSDLPEFLDATEYLVDHIAGPWDMIVIPREYRYLVRASWAELQPTFEKMKKDCKQPGKIKRALESAGLTRQQLRLKLQAVAAAWKRFAEHGTTKLLASVVGWTKLVINSLGTAIPHAEAVKEILDVIERFLKGEDLVATL